uniref:autophagy-related protein 16-1 n=1 Tax=Semicossyphus pulcher TaxID=241346 RepID=UPI0037E85C69
MSSWRNHVRTSLQQRDKIEKIPYAGVFTCLSQLEERFELSQTVSDLTSVLYLKESELQYRQARVSLYRQEALTLARRSNTQRAALSELEHTIECQSKELTDLHAEVRGLKKALVQAQREKDELLQRWMEEKRVEADRLNKYNATQERWQRLAKRLKKKKLHIEIGKEYVPVVMNSWSGPTEMPPAAIHWINNTTEMKRAQSDSNHVPTVTRV